MMGHVNNATYLTYFETARTKYLLQLKGLKPPHRWDDLDFIVAKVTCEYKRGLRWGERVEVVVWPSRIGETSFDFSYAIIDERGQLAARSETVQVSFDYQTNAKKAIPAPLRKALEAEMRAGPGIPLPEGRG